MNASTHRLFETVTATWPPARTFEHNGWRIREGRGGGQRVSAATALVQSPDITAMEDAHREIRQDPLVMIRPGENALDRQLHDADYELRDSTVALMSSVRSLAGDHCPGYVAWPPLAMQREIWASGGVGPARLEIMARVAGKRTSLMARRGDTPVATAFVAVAGDVAMVHALEVLPEARRKGIASELMRTAADWAVANGASSVAVLVVRANLAAVRLYRSLGMEEAGHYNYRRLSR